MSLAAKFGARFDAALMRPPTLGGAHDPALSARLRAWCLSGQAFAAASTPPHPALDAFACELDGSARLQGLSSWRGLAWRAQVKLADLVPGRALHPDDPWDCGWLRPQALEGLAQWQPRRATLLMTHDAGAAGLLRLKGAKPVRLLLVSAEPVPGLARL